VLTSSNTGTPVILLLDAATSTGSSNWKKLGGTFGSFALQGVAGSTGAVILLEGRLTEDSTSPVTLVTFDRTTDPSGTVKFAAGTPVAEVRATLNAGASSGGASAWMAATP